MRQRGDTSYEAIVRSSQGKVESMSDPLSSNGNDEAGLGEGGREEEDQPRVQVVYVETHPGIWNLYSRIDVEGRFAHPNSSSGYRWK